MYFIIRALYRAFADEHLILEIQVTGNNRVDSNTIITYSNINTNDAYSSLLADESLRNLYETELFSDVNIEYYNSVLTINVKENYVINRDCF